MWFLETIIRYLRPHWIRNYLSTAFAEIETFALSPITALLQGECITVLSPHPDDEVIGCGGAIAAWLKAGKQVYVIYLTDGAAGDAAIRDLASDDPQRLDAMKRLAATRRQEADAAMRLLGVDNVTFLPGVDGKLTTTEEVSEGLANHLRSFRPDAVALPFLTDRHRDHVAATGCLVAAMKRSGHRPKNIFGYEIWAPLPANILLDIGPFVAVKRAALQCYQSQLATCDYVDGALGLNRYRAVTGMMKDGYAEAYHSLSPKRLMQLWERIVI